MVLFGFFGLVLIVIYWINRAVILFDQLIADGQSAGVFLEFTALSLPSVMRLALPLAAFAAAVYVTNRLRTESELTVMQATGYSPFRLARPVLYFGAIVALIMSVLMHFLVPLSSARLEQREAEIAQNLTARLLNEGQFIEPISGVTVYIREISANGELHDVFLSDTRNPQTHVTYTAKRAFLVRDEDRTQLVMLDGMVQNLRLSTQRLSTTTFRDFAYDIGQIVGAPQTRGRRDRHLFTWELLNPTEDVIAETGRKARRLIALGHDRISQSILGMVAALLGFSALMVGGHSRFGVWKQIFGAVFLIIVVKAVETTGLRLSRSDAQLWWAAYLQSAVGLILVWLLLLWAGRPYLFKRAVKRADAQ